MGDIDSLKQTVEELAERTWDVPAIEARYRKLASEGIPKLDRQVKIQLAEKDVILDRVQRRAEEYNFLFKNCARGTATALLEEFGLGHMEVIQALAPFPGIGGTGSICGGVTGSLIALGLFFGGRDLLDIESGGAAIMKAQMFMNAFKDRLGSLKCADIQEHIVFGRNMDPGASQENMEAFAEAKGFEKCGLPPGIGARLAAGIMIDSFKE